MGTLWEQPLPSPRSILYSQAVQQQKSRSEWTKKSLSLWHYQLQKDCVQKKKKSPNCLTHCLKVFHIHFTIRVVLSEVISERGPKRWIRLERFIHFGVKALPSPPVLQTSVDPIYLHQPKRNGREDGREPAQLQWRRGIEPQHHGAALAKTWMRAKQKSASTATFSFSPSPDKSFLDYYLLLIKKEHCHEENKTEIAPLGGSAEAERDH